MTCSGNPGPEHLAGPRALGAEALAKPFRLDDLLAAVGWLVSAP